MRGKLDSTVVVDATTFLPFSLIGREGGAFVGGLLDAQYTISDLLSWAKLPSQDAESTVLPGVRKPQLMHSKEKPPDDPS